MSPGMRASGQPIDLGLPERSRSIYRDVLPLLWPEGRSDLRTRVVLAFIAMLAAKIFTVYAPFFYRDAVNVLTAEDTTTVLVVVPVALVVSYGLARIMMIAMAQLRDGLFAQVGQNAVRTLAIRTFRHIHALSLRFHLERRTGGLSRIIERGTKAIEFLLRFSLFSIFPTIIELLLVAGILWWNFDWRYAAVTGVVIAIYVAYTYRATEKRTLIRREMNEKDTEANTRAIDSLLNYETVKYFGSEEREQKRFDVSMRAYEKAAIKNFTSLAFLNAGQALLFTTGLTICMWMAARGVANGTMTVGDFVMVNHDPTVGTAQSAGVGLPRNPPGPDRYGDHVFSHRRNT